MSTKSNIKSTLLYQNKLNNEQKVIDLPNQIKELATKVFLFFI